MCISMQLLMAKQTLWYVCRGVVIFTDEVWCSLMLGGLFGRYLISSLMLERSTVGTEMLERGKKASLMLTFLSSMLPMIKHICSVYFMGMIIYTRAPKSLCQY